jgi:hypothetical protein
MNADDKRYYSLFPKTLASCVEPLTRPVLKTQGLAGSRVLTEWESIVGVQLSHHTTPEKLSFPNSKKTGGKKTGGTLVISVENGFATELQHMQPMILERLASYFGYQAINRIAISHTWPTEIKAEPVKPKATLPRESCALTDGIEDDELRDALKSLAETLSGSSV